jgi:hypothetical protein
MENKSLVEFQWEDSGDDVFFNEKPVEETPKKEDIEETDEGDKDDKDDTTQKSKPQDTKKEEDVEFNDFKVEEQQIRDNNTSIFKDFYDDLKQAGIFKHTNIEEQNLENMDSTKFLELQSEEYEKEVSERIKNWAKEELDEDARAFIKFKREGGSTADFFNIYREVSDIPEGDLEDESYQDEVIRYQLELEGWDNDEIEDRLEYLKESGKKLVQAKKYEAKIKEQREEEKKRLLEETERQNKSRALQEESYKKEIKDVLDNTDEIKGFKITPQEKYTILNMLTKKDYKTPNKTFVTGFQKKLAEVFQDSEKTILLAKLLNNDFDFSQFEKKVIDKKTKEIKTNLEQRRDLKSPNFGSSLSGKKSLADFF